jgi:ankyrin repeat protein
METFKFARSKLKCVLDGEADLQTAVQWPLRTSQRLLVAIRRKQLRYSPNSKRSALELCQLIGLVRSSVDEINELGESRLIQAAAEDASPSALRLLIKAGACLNAATPEGFTAVFRASQYGNADCLEVLIKARADAESGHKEGATPLFVAAQNQHPSCLRILIEARVSIDSTCDDGATPLLMASQCGYQDCVELLLKAGANVNHTKKNGITSIFTAAIHSNIECIQLLKAAGADLNVRYQGLTPLETVLRKGGVRMRACVAALESSAPDSCAGGSTGKAARRPGKRRGRGRGQSTAAGQASEPLSSADTISSGAAGHSCRGRRLGGATSQSSEPLAASD